MVTVLVSCGKVGLEVSSWPLAALRKTRSPVRIYSFFMLRCQHIRGIQEIDRQCIGPGICWTGEIVIKGRVGSIRVKAEDPSISCIIAIADRVLVQIVIARAIRGQEEILAGCFKRKRD